MWSFCAAVCVLGSLQVCDGTIVVLENSNPVVEVVTRSEITHVGMIFHGGGAATVYEATPSEVRRLGWSDYCDEIARLNRGRRAKNQIRVRLYQPVQPYSQVEARTMEEFLRSQLGRRYSIRGYVRGKPGDGIHCAEMVSTALVRSGRFQFPPNYSVSPVALVSQIRPSHQAPLDVAPALSQPAESWCDRSWRWWGEVFVWCGWASQETWLFCR